MRVLTNVFNYAEAQELKSFLETHNINVEIPDVYSLGITGASNLARGTGRILVAEEQFEEAQAFSKEWTSTYQTDTTKLTLDNLRHPAAVGISPKEIWRGMRGWTKLRFMGRVQVIGGILVYGSILVSFLTLLAVR